MPHRRPLSRRLIRSSAFSLIALGAVVLAAGVLQPALVDASKRIRVDWDNYQPPGTGNRGNITAGVIERLKRIYTNFLDELVFVTSDNNSGIDITVKVNSGSVAGHPLLFGDAHAIGNSSADVYGGVVNTHAGYRGTTAESDMVNILGREVAHELGHDLGLEHTWDTNDLMCAGGHLYGTQRFDTTHERIGSAQSNTLRGLLAVAGGTGASGAAGHDHCMRCIRGITDDDPVIPDDDTAIEYFAQFGFTTAPLTFGWLNSIGEFVPSHVTSAQPGNITLFPGDCNVFAARNDITTEIEELHLENVLPITIVPQPQALDPIPPGDYYSRLALQFPLLGVNVGLDATQVYGMPQAFDNGMYPEPGGGPGVPFAGQWGLALLSLFMLASGFVVLRRTRAVA